LAGDGGGGGVGGGMEGADEVVDVGEEAGVAEGLAEAAEGEEEELGFVGEGHPGYWRAIAGFAWGRHAVFVMESFFVME
jgi:hypothetical protein